MVEDKVMILLRGLPGAGKSTFAKMLISSDPSLKSKHIEADMFHYDQSGKYNFKIKNLPLAHRWCESEVLDACKYSLNLIVVSNTFTTERELEPYIHLAKQYDYKVISLVVENRHGNKSIHNVPEETIQKMKNRFSIKL